MASVREQSNDGRDEAREDSAKGTVAAKESAKEFKGAMQQEGLAAMKGFVSPFPSLNFVLKI